MKILIVGGSGMLGRLIVDTLTKSSKDILYPSSNEMNLCNRKQVMKYFSDNKIDYVIHCAGFTDVNEAENNLDAYKINCESMYWIVFECRMKDIPLLYFSTDYVFDGTKSTPYDENDIKNPLNTYGLTKSLSEDIIIANLLDYRIIRISWLFGNSKKCFPAKIISKLNENKEFAVVCDQIGSPTYVNDIAYRIGDLIKLPIGIYHLSNFGETSWYDFAILIAEYLNIKNNYVKKGYSELTNNYVKRPLNSMLDNQKINSLNIKLRDYKEAIKEYLDQYEN